MNPALTILGVSILVLIFGLIVFLIVYVVVSQVKAAQREALLRERLKHDGMLAQSRILDCRLSWATSGLPRFVTFSYTWDGRTYTCQQVVKRGTSLVQGASVDIRLLPDNPSVARLVGTDSDEASWGRLNLNAIVGALLFFLAFFLIFILPAVLR